MYLLIRPPRSSCQAYKVRDYDMQWGCVIDVKSLIGVDARRELGAHCLDITVSCRNENRWVVRRIRIEINITVFWTLVRRAIVGVRVRVTH